GLADQLFERGALEHAFGQLAPVVIGRGREVRGEGQIVSGGRHRFPRTVLLIGPEIATWRRPSQTLFWPVSGLDRPRGGAPFYCAWGCFRYFVSGSRSIPSVERPVSASATRRPAMTRSGAISASGTSTKARSNRRGCGSVSSGLSSFTSS